MQLQDCLKVDYFFYYCAFFVFIVEATVMRLNTRYLTKKIPKFGKEHYYYFWKMGAGIGAREEWLEASLSLWKRMVIPWKALGFTDEEASLIAKIEFYAVIELFVSGIVAIILFEGMFIYVGRSLGLCS